MVQYYKPYGVDPKSEVETKGSTYKIIWYPNETNPLIIDSSGVTE
jgi:hypothetical protein